MHRITRQRRSAFGLMLSGALTALVAAVLAASASGGTAQTDAATVVCPITAAEVSAIVGRTVQRVNLSEDDGDPMAQCAFSAVSRSSGTKRLVGPQVFLTVEPGGATDLHDLYTYYVGVRAKLATRPRVATRSDLGTGAFTLTATTVPVTSAFFLLGKAGVGALTVDLTGAPLALRNPDTADKVFTTVHGRLH
jgi:hypothetical protein